MPGVGCRVSGKQCGRAQIVLACRAVAFSEGWSSFSKTRMQNRERGPPRILAGLRTRTGGRNFLPEGTSRVLLQQFTWKLDIPGWVFAGKMGTMKRVD